MGGGGGGWYSGREEPRDLGKRLFEAMERDIASKEREQYAEEYLSSILVDANSRDIETTNERLEDVAAAISDDVGEPIDLRFGGSVEKHTYVEGMSDVDVLALVRKESLVQSDPDKFLRRFARSVRDLDNVDNVKVGQLAVTIRYKDGSEIQVLPAARHGEGYRISDGKGGWVNIQPRRFTRVLTAANRKLRGRLVPAIKLAKALLASHPIAKNMRSHHIEAIAVEAAKRYEGSTTNRQVLKHIVGYAAQAVLTPIPDRTGQSQQVDAYLGPQHSPQRQLLSDALRRIDRRLRVADLHGVDAWQELFGE